MKPDIHPPYYPEATVKCACGNTFTVGSTRPKIEVEICHKCHPFYTGEEKLIDTAGRVERFRTRIRTAEVRLGKANARRAETTTAPKKKRGIKK